VAALWGNGTIAGFCDDDDDSTTEGGNVDHLVS
jgi:hypothetical protein